LLIFETDIHIS